MTLIPETGAGVPDANSYASVALISAYWTARPHAPLATIWAAAAADAQSGAAIEASAYLDATYGPYYQGRRRGYLQGMQWPRTGTDDGTGYTLPDMPQELVRAVCELAVRALSNPLAADAERGGQVKRITEKVGPIEETTEYSESAIVETRYGFIDGLLAPVLNGAQPGGPGSWPWR